MERRTFLLAGIALAVLQTISTPANAGEDRIYQSFFGTAIDGTDPVSYFDEGRPVEGDADITYSWNGAMWRFANAENRDRFAADPEAYAPQYGGYCAWAIVDGKLYLNYSLSVQETWARDVPGNIAAADKNWPGVLD